MTSIIQKENPTLRKVAQAVSEKEIGSTKLRKILDRMISALEGEEDGVAIAAPQIDQSLRIFIISHKVFDIIKKYKDKEIKDMIFINPKIIKLSKDKEMVEEGCLSVRYLYGKVLRSKRATVEATDEYGNHFTMGASGLLAQIFQHETDHLDGKLFIDTAEGVEEVIPEHVKRREMESEKK